jgi:hypothetical protein
MQSISEGNPLYLSASPPLSTKMEKINIITFFEYKTSSQRHINIKIKNKYIRNAFVV